MCGGWGEVGEPRGGRKERAVFPRAARWHLAAISSVPVVSLSRWEGEGRGGCPDGTGWRRWDGTGSDETGWDWTGREETGWNGTGWDGMQWDGTRYSLPQCLSRVLSPLLYALPGAAAGVLETAAGPSPPAGECPTDAPKDLSPAAGSGQRLVVTGKGAGGEKGNAGLRLTFQ